MQSRFHTHLIAGLACALTFGAAGVALTQDKPEAPKPPSSPVKPAVDGNRGPFEVAFTKDGTRALVTEFDEGALAVIEVASGKVLSHIPTGGEQPTGVAVTPDSATALVTNSFDGSLAFVDLKSQKATTMPLPGGPYDVVLSPDGKTAYVSVSQLDHVAIVDVAGRNVVGKMATGRRPRALALTPDGRVLAAGNFTQGSISFLDTAGRRLIGNGPTPAVNLRGVAIYPDGRMAYCTAQRAQNERPTETAIGIWSNQSFHVQPNGRPNTVENVWLDFIGKDVSDPESVVFDPEYSRVFITCSGGHSVNVLGVRGQDNPQTVQNVGAHPKGLAFRPDGKEVWVANHLGNDLAVIDPASLKITRRINLGPTKRKDPTVMGRFLFSTATIVNGAQFSCNSCHPDGNTDGISWKFVHVADQFGKTVDRNVRSLRGGLQSTAPFRWTGFGGADLHEFVKEEVHGLLQGPKLTDPEVDAMVEYIRNIPLPHNPYRTADGKITESGLRGKLLFEGKADCGSCHTGPMAGGQRKAWIGTTPEGTPLDVPHLAGVYDSYPYFHDGRAKTLEDLFARHNDKKLHGKADQLTPEEMKDLLDYVRQL